MKNELIEKINTKEAVIGIVGLGYVGLPLLIEFSKAGFKTIGLDVDSKKTEALLKGESYIKHIASAHIESVYKNGSGNLATTDFSKVSDCDAIIICVPTPLTAHREPDLSYIESTSASIAPYVKKGQLISLESTTYPGTTDSVMTPIIENESGLKGGEDFFVAYSPEREDPNNKDFGTATIPKVVGGLSPASLEVAQALYNCVICKTVPVSSCRAAEATKLMENIFRSVNIALVNELKVVFSPMDIDIWEVINAAKTKPFGYMPFYPGPGLGGHCIPIDPFYLTWKAREYDVTTRFIELAGEINTSMPDYVIQQTFLALNNQGKAIKNSRILLIGLAYKKNVDDDRESPSYVLWKKLEGLGAKVSYYDPYCPEVRPSREHSELAGIVSVKWEDITEDSFDAAVIVTAHDCVDHEKLAELLPLIIDTRGTLKSAPNIVSA